MTLSNRCLTKLSHRGIEIALDSHGPIINISAKGVAWLLNFKMTKDIRYPLTLTKNRLREIADAVAVPNLYRTLAVKLITLPIADRSSDYFAFAFYLEATPPRQVNLLEPIGSGEFQGRIEVYKGLFKAFNPIGDQGITILFSKEEIAELTNGEVLRISCGELP